MKSLTAIGAGVLLTFAAATGSQAADTLNILCGVDEVWCAVMEKTYEAKTGLAINMARMSTGEILDRVRAEKNARPLMFGGAAQGSRICRPPMKVSSNPIVPNRKQTFCPGLGTSSLCLVAHLSAFMPGHSDSLTTVSFWRLQDCQRPTAGRISQSRSIAATSCLETHIRQAPLSQRL